MGLLSKQQLKAIVEKMPAVRKQKLLKEREKRKKERELDSKVKGINISLNKLSKLPASDILKLIFSMKESKTDFTLT
jgi:hypothetical protein